MRLPLIPKSELTDAQKPLYDDMRSGIEANFDSFTAIDDDTGALMGPWNPWLHSPKMGKQIWEMTKAVSSDSLLPPQVREVAILVVGAHFDSAYEIYAHNCAGLSKGMDENRLATIVSGTKPDGLPEEMAVAYDAAHALTQGNILPRPTYDRAVRAFGKDGAAELIYLIGMYCLVSITLNGFNVPVPAGSE